MNKKILTLAALACSLALPALAQSPSAGRSVVYTDTSGKACKSHVQGGGEISEWKCKGLGREVYLMDAVTRGGVVFGKDGEHEPAFVPSQDFVGKKIEWRLQDGRPYATIFRAYVQVEVPNAPVPKWIDKQVLVVTKIDGDDACHIAYVDASIKDANAKAAELADANSASFKCGADKPQRVGNPAPFGLE